MRIYVIANSTALKMSLLTKLAPYYYENRQIHYIWSVKNGLMQVVRDKIYQMRIKDVNVVKTLMGAFPVTIDRSEIIREEECYQIPPKNYNEIIDLKVYRLTPTSNIDWIFEYKNGEMHDNYFYSGEEDINKIDILQFLQFI